MEPSRRAIGFGLASAIFPASFMGACASSKGPRNSRSQNANSNVLLPIISSPPRDELLDAYNCFLGVPLARFSEITLPAPDGFAITVRIAIPAVVTGRIPIITCSPDFGDDALNYDILAGGLASRGYAVLSISASGTLQDRGDAAAARRITRRGHQMSFVLDNLPKVLSAIGRDSQMVDTAKIGVVGCAEAAWTALGMVGWGRNLVPSSAIADARITASFALAPSLTPVQQRNQARSLGRVIYGRTMIASDFENMPVLPNGSGIIGVNLPPITPGFGGIIGAKPIVRRGRSPRPQREILASACAAASLFFDWSLKGEKNKLDILMAGNGRLLGQMVQPFSIVRV